MKTKFCINDRSRRQQRAFQNKHQAAVGWITIKTRLIEMQYNIKSLNWSVWRFMFFSYVYKKYGKRIENSKRVKWNHTYKTCELLPGSKKSIHLPSIRLPQYSRARAYKIYVHGFMYLCIYVSILLEELEKWWFLFYF